jgi:ubiquinone/menaquinone biosynthesis C-methylase UbiE
LDHSHEHERRFKGDPSRLRSAERLARLDVPRVMELTRAGLTRPSVLDVGTGTGVFAEAFAAAGCTVTGIDTNADLLALARQHVPAGDFREAAAETLPFAAGSFDLVFLGVVLHETDDSLAALTEARRVAKSRVAVLEWPYREGTAGPPLAHRISPERIKDLSARAGFRQIESVQLEHVDLYLLAP